MPTIPVPTPEQALDAYRPLVENFDQAVPLLVWATATEVTPVQVIPPEGEDLPLGLLYAGVAAQMVATLGHPQWVLHSSEAWTVELESFEQAQSYQHGDAAAMAAAGDTSVREVAMFVLVATDGEWTAQVPFKRTPEGVQWDAIERSLQAEGGIADVLKALVR